MSIIHAFGAEVNISLQDFLSQGSFTQAYDRCEAILIDSRATPNELKEACEVIEALFPNLDLHKSEAIIQQACKRLADFPALNDLQVKFLCHFGDLAIKKDSSLLGCALAMRSYATAFLLKSDSIVDAKLNKVHLAMALFGYKYQLQQAAGRGDVQHFRSLLLNAEKLHQKFSQNPRDIQHFYQCAREIYQELNPKNKEIFTDVLSIIEKGETLEVPLDPHQQSQSTIYRNSLNNLRLKFSHQEETRVFQANRMKDFCSFYALLLEDAILMLGAPPCHYDIRAMGSLAREEVCPYSDLEYFILIDNSACTSYFKKLAQIFDIQIISLGETDPKHQGIFDFGQKTGIEIDHQSNPAFHDELIGTPEQVFRLKPDPNSDDLKAYKSRLRSISLKQSSLFPLPRLNLDSYFQDLLAMRRVEFQQLQILQGDECQVKQEFIEPLFHFISDLALSLGLEAMNTLDIIEQIPHFDSLSKDNLRFSVAFLYNFRVRLHISHGGINENAALSDSLGMIRISERERETLEWIHNLVITPLYLADFSENVIDLTRIALLVADPNVVAKTAHFLRDSPYEVHLSYYQRLNEPSQQFSQRRYIENVPSHAKKLSLIPNRAGYRQSRRIEEMRFFQHLQTMATDDPKSGVKISSHIFQPKYLTVEACEKLFDSKGHIKMLYSKSLHRVSSYKECHFKELPFQPLMEFAIHSLIHRLMGQATPSGTLIRVEIPDKNLSYPVWVSETISGKPLDASMRLNQEHLTWLLLSEILTKPGDGRISNYVVRFGRVYCVDNDISFMKPVVKNRIGQDKPAFCSALFTLNPPLEKKVLEEFCRLEPDLILMGWLDELAEQERRNLSLFHDSNELKLHFEQDKKRQFTPKLLLPKGAVATLIMQFHHLQRVLMTKEFPDACSLLGELVTHEKRVGPLVESRYRKTLTHPFEKRLKVALDAPMESSITSEKAMKMSLDSVPTTHQVLEEGTYSIKEAQTELCLLEAQRQSKAFSIVNDEENFSLEADFGHIEDQEREKLMLQAFILLFEAQPQKPRVLALKNTKTLTDDLLEPLLHPQLRSLDLSYGLQVTRRTLDLLEKRCPLLSSLSLEGCQGVDKFSLNLPHLKTLNLKKCSQITTLNIASLQLDRLQITNFPTNPQDCFALGVRFARGEGVDQDHERAKQLWQQAASMKDKQAQEVMQWVDKMSEGTGRVELRRLKDVQIEALAYAFEVQTGISELTLKSGKISDRGAACLAQILDRNTTITSLDLTSNEIGPLGAEHLAKALKVNRTLNKLILDWNKLGPLGAQHLTEGLEGNDVLVKLHLSKNEIGDEGAAHVAKFLEKNRALTGLALVGNNISAAGAINLSKALEGNHTLNFLELDENKIGPNGGIVLANALEKNNGLRVLFLRGCDIGPAGARAFARSFKVNTTLVHLSLHSNKIRDDGLKAVAEGLLENKTLRKVNLLYNEIGPTGATALGRLLGENQTISCLYLLGNEVGSEGAIALADGLQFNHGLGVLLLGANKIGDKGVQAIARALESNSTLYELGLQVNEIRDEGAKALASALYVNRTLIKLELVGDVDETNSIHKLGFQSLQEALEINNTLTEFKIQVNRQAWDRTTGQKIEDQVKNPAIVKAIKEKVEQNRLLGLLALKAAEDRDESLLNLIDQGVSLYFKDNNGNTIFHFFAGNGDVAWMQKLLKFKPNLSILNNDLRTPLDLAKLYGKHEVMKLLS